MMTSAAAPAATGDAAGRFLLEALGIWERFGGVPALAGADFWRRRGSVHALGSPAFCVEVV